MPTPLEWTRRAADILLDERNKRYLGMTEPMDRPQTAAGRAHWAEGNEGYCHCGRFFSDNAGLAGHIRNANVLAEAAADPSGLRAALNRTAQLPEDAPPSGLALQWYEMGWHDRGAALAAKDSGSPDPFRQGVHDGFWPDCKMPLPHTHIPTATRNPPRASDQEAEG